MDFLMDSEFCEFVCTLKSTYLLTQYHMSKLDNILATSASLSSGASEVGISQIK